ncbi:unnamed protein product [Parascedosporium putredinis]|uniref:Plasma membrane fusion protein PRM1 n=1 Tax=Parascedosporium putredinis TaxID=1442378 RepID=A0A9P1HCA2_9PEZI|nr:unnamed protein product [Parascedosporium putredinis]CAI8004167.1 unnamed protein product [Parascedosporium putredinis]
MNKLDMLNRLRGHPKPRTYPELPNSLRSQSVELDDFRKVHVTRAPTAPEVTPYLSLRSRLSQIWINRWTVLLLLVLVRVMIAVTDLDDDIGEAKIKALQACTKVEDIGSAMSSMPHYLSLGLAVTVIENLIIFVINMMVSTYVCLASAVIHGTLDVAADVVEKFTKAMNGAISGIANGISSDAKSIQDKINDLTSSIEESVFGPILPDIPDVDFTSALDKLKDLKIDTSGFVADIDTLNNKIPTFDDVRNLTERAISFPFQLIKKEINESLAGFTFDRDVFPVAQKQKLTFCSDNDNINGFFDGLYTTVSTARTAFIAVVIVLALLAMVVMGWLEIKRWRRQQAHARIIEANQYDPMDVVYLASRPTTSAWGIKIAARFQGKRQVLARWCVAYATSLPAVFVLSLAIAGFFSCLCQFIVLRAVQHKVPELANQVGDFAGDVVESLQGVSKQWATDANSVIINFNDEINNDVLGFVTEGTDAVNNTLNTFTAQMEKGIDALFGDTVLNKVASDLIRCVIGLKIEAVQKGLTWLHDQARVDFPLFSEDTFSLGAQESISGDSDLTTFLASPSSVTTDEVTGAVQKVVDSLHKSILIEALISTGLLCVYIIIVLIGVVRTLAGMATPDRTRGEGGAAPTTADLQHRDTYGEGFNDYYENGNAGPGYYNAGDAKSTGGAPGPHPATATATEPSTISSRGTPLYEAMPANVVIGPPPAKKVKRQNGQSRDE